MAMTTTTTMAMTPLGRGSNCSHQGSAWEYGVAEVTDGRPEQRLIGHLEACSAVAFRARTQQVISAGTDGLLIVWDHDSVAAATHASSVNRATSLAAAEKRRLKQQQQQEQQQQEQQRYSASAVSSASSLADTLSVTSAGGGFLAPYSEDGVLARLRRNRQRRVGVGGGDGTDFDTWSDDDDDGDGAFGPRARWRQRQAFQQQQQQGMYRRRRYRARSHNAHI